MAGARTSWSGDPARPAEAGTRRRGAGSGGATARKLEKRLDGFFARVATLSPEEVARLHAAARRGGSGGAGLTKTRLETDPDYLSGITAGRWTVLHEHLAADLQRRARAHARVLAGWRQRRALTLAVTGAGLVVLADGDASTQFTAPLRQRLAGAWESALGPLS